MSIYFIKVCAPEQVKENLERLQIAERGPYGSHKRLITPHDLEEVFSLDPRYRGNQLAQSFLRRLFVAGAPIYLFRICQTLQVNQQV